MYVLSMQRSSTHANSETSSPFTKILSLKIEFFLSKFFFYRHTSISDLVPVTRQRLRL